MRRRRWRWLAVGLVLAVGLYFVADVVLAQYLESRGAAEIARTMSAEEATVELGGVPFIPRFLRGRLTDVGVTVRGASAARGLRISSLETRMGSVTFSPGRIFALSRSSFATQTEVNATEAVAILELTERDLEEFIRRQIPVVGDVAVRASGIEVRFLEDPADAELEQPDDEQLGDPARFLPRVEDGRLVLALISVSQIQPNLRGAAARIERLIDLPQIPAGLRADVSLRERVVVVEAQGPEVTLELGEGEL